MIYYCRPQLLSLSLLYYGDGENNIFLHRRKPENNAEDNEVEELIC